MTAHDVLILGGGYAGLAAARKLSTIAPSASVTLIDQSPQFSERIRLHEVAAGSTPLTLPYEAVLSKKGVRFRQGRVLRLKLDQRRVELAEGHLSYRILVYALGSGSPAVPGAWVPSSLEAATALRETLSSRSGRVAIVGAGLTGIEFAAEIAERLPEWQVSLVAGDSLRASEEPGGYTESAVFAMRKTLTQLRVRIVDGSRALGVCGGNVELSQGEVLPTELCIWTTGFAVPPLARESGLATNGLGQIVTDKTLRSRSHPEVIAVGDAAEAVPLGAAPCRMGCATALASGLLGARTAAAALAGRAGQPFRFSYLFRNVSLGRADAVVQFVDQEDRPRSLVWIGARAVRWKEYICKSTLSTSGLVAAPRPSALPPLTFLPQMLRAMAQYA